MDILFFEPTYKNYIWGGTKIKEQFNKKTPFDTTAESWEIAANKNGKSVIINGEFKGLDLEQLFRIKEIRSDYFGTKCEELNEFPLLIKFIDAKKDLSVQVHPNEEYARKYENNSGKSELWYVIDCKKNAKLVYGLKGISNKQNLIEIIKKNDIKNFLNYINIEKGDAIFIPAGTIHAILSGCLICEIQQNSDLTYRIYDWDRVDKNGKQRELHIDKAIDVITFNKNERKIKSNNGNLLQNLLDSQYFKVDKLNIKGEYSSISKEETFCAFCVIDGKGIICSNKKSYKIAKGDSFLIPAKLGKYKICGNLRLLKSYM